MSKEQIVELAHQFLEIGAQTVEDVSWHEVVIALGIASKAMAMTAIAVNKDEGKTDWYLEQAIERFHEGFATKVDIDVKRAH